MYDVSVCHFQWHRDFKEKKKKHVNHLRIKIHPLARKASNKLYFTTLMTLSTYFLSYVSPYFYLSRLYQ